jgi:hypothetical protein
LLCESFASHSGNLPDRSIGMNAVIVRARFDSQTLEPTDPQFVAKGDLGLLKWKRHRRHPRFLEPCVVWDKDPHRKVRRVILSSIAVVGLETGAARVLVHLRPS